MGLAVGYDVGVGLGGNGRVVELDAIAVDVISFQSEVGEFGIGDICDVVNHQCAAVG